MDGYDHECDEDMPPPSPGLGTMGERVRKPDPDYGPSHFQAAADAWAEAAARWDEAVGWAHAVVANHRIGEARWKEAADMWDAAGVAAGTDGANVASEAVLVEVHAAIRMAVHGDEMVLSARKALRKCSKAASAARDAATAMWSAAECELAQGDRMSVVEELRVAQAHNARAEKSWEAVQRAETRARDADAEALRAVKARSQYDPTVVRKSAEAAGAWAASADRMVDVFTTCKDEADAMRRTLAIMGDRAQ